MSFNVTKDMGIGKAFWYTKGRTGGKASASSTSRQLGPIPQNNSLPNLKLKARGLKLVSALTPKPCETFS
jgi:hypothetical protein